MNEVTKNGVPDRTRTCLFFRKNINLRNLKGYEKEADGSMKIAELISVILAIKIVLLSLINKCLQISS